MLVDSLRRMDRYVGIPLCSMLSVARALRSAIGTKQILPKPRKVLVIKLSEMGSSVLSYPALAQLKNRCPELLLYFLVFANNVDILEALKLTPPEHFITIDYQTPWTLLVERIGGATAAFAGAVRHSHRHGFFQPDDGIDRFYRMSWQ